MVETVTASLGKGKVSRHPSKEESLRPMVKKSSLDAAKSCLINRPVSPAFLSGGRFAEDVDSEAALGVTWNPQIFLHPFSQAGFAPWE